MRLMALLRGDMRFQFKYGFYFIYIVFSLLYIGLLAAFPESWRGKAAVLMIFTDPAALGLFFMGAIVLFEKSERVMDSLAVAPIKISDYVLAKLISIGIISTAVAIVIGLFGGVMTQPLLFIPGVFLSSCLFSSLGLIVAARARTLNGFMLSTIPLQLLVNLPAIAYLFGWDHKWLLLHPGAGTIEILLGGRFALAALPILLVWMVLAVLLACRVVKKAFEALGGVKL